MEEEQGRTWRARKKEPKKKRNIQSGITTPTHEVDGGESYYNLAYTLAPVSFSRSDGDALDPRNVWNELANGQSIVCLQHVRCDSKTWRRNKGGFKFYVSFQISRQFVVCKKKTTSRGVCVCVSEWIVIENKIRRLQHFNVSVQDISWCVRSIPFTFFVL